MDEEVEGEQKMERLKRKKRIENERVKKDWYPEKGSLWRCMNVNKRWGDEKGKVLVNGTNGNIFSPQQEKYVILSLFWYLKNASAQQKNG